MKKENQKKETQGKKSHKDNSKQSHNKKRGAPKKSRLGRFILALFFLLLVAGGLVGLDFYQKVFIPYAGYSDPGVTLEVPKGAAVSSIARDLYQRGIISGYNYFLVYYRLFFKDLRFKTGEYHFSRPMTMREVILKLNEGKVVLYKVTVPEGLIIPEIARLVAGHPRLSVDEGEFIRLARSPRLIKAVDPGAPDLEGYLFPDTYMVRRGVTAAEMVNMMVERFKEHFSGSLVWRTQELDLSVREVLTLASLIEKETAMRDERFLISSVFHNRLRIGMAMGCDPTVIYALKRDNRYRGKLGWKELKYDSPYNTRIYRGLPPGPICSPGFDSIEAALYPETSKYLYFVAKDSRSHYFSTTLKEHNRAVRKYIINGGRK